MTPLQILLLALLQGVTEFLPISSSAHLILLPHAAGWADQGLRFDVAVNTGTLLAVVAYFRGDLWQLGRAGLGSLGKAPSAWGVPERLAWFLVLGTVPVGLCGLLLWDWIATSARDPLLIAATSIGFGLLLWAADRWGRRQRPLESLGWRDAALVGLAQALALVPGTSRSGATITAGLALGLTRTAAARFSFLLAVPVSVLAGAKDAWELVHEPPPAADLLGMLLALAVAALSAYAVIGWLLAWLQRQSLTVFVVYRVLLGLVILGVYLLG